MYFCPKGETWYFQLLSLSNLVQPFCQVKFAGIVTWEIAASPFGACVWVCVLCVGSSINFSRLARWRALQPIFLPDGSTSHEKLDALSLSNSLVHGDQQKCRHRMSQRGDVHPILQLRLDCKSSSKDLPDIGWALAAFLQLL